MHNASIIADQQPASTWTASCRCGFSIQVSDRNRALRIARRHTEDPEISHAVLGAFDEMAVMHFARSRATETADLSQSRMETR